MTFESLMIKELDRRRRGANGVVDGSTVQLCGQLLHLEGIIQHQMALIRRNPYKCKQYN